MQANIRNLFNCINLYKYKKGANYIKFKSFDEKV